jgi:hypothetical protein
MRQVIGAVLATALSLGMAGPSSAQVVLNEILVLRGGGSHVDQIIELKNTGADAQAVGGWVVYHENISSSTIPGGTSIPAGGLLVLHFNQSGTNSATDVYFPGDELSEISDLGLYANNSSFANPANLRAFVQWGGVPPAGRQNVAQTAGLWTSNTFIPLPPASHSLELCSGVGSSPSSYIAQSSPSIGSSNLCGVGTEEVSWSSIKSIFQK